MSKRKPNLKKSILNTPGFSSGFSGGFPGYIEQEHLYIDITNRVKPHTNSIILHVKQHGKELGAIQMTRRP